MPLKSHAQNAQSWEMSAGSARGNRTGESLHTGNHSSNIKDSTRGRRADRTSTVSSDDHQDDNGSPHPNTNLDPAKLVAAVVSQPSSKTMPLFVGEGGYGEILNATGTGTAARRHFFIPAETEKALALEDLAYLKTKGCFSLPDNSDDLLRAYFRFVHPSFPILDGPSFLRDYALGGTQKLNLLLLWSMFSVAASYVPGHSRKIVKESFVQRAKLLFDLSHENDKLVLVQSTLLLSFWFAEAEDIKQSWYWSGIAFGIGQTLGLHRDLKAGSESTTIPQRSLWRNLWRCCMLRDVWLAFGMGRPLRLNKADCTVPVRPTSEYQFRNITLNGKALYSSEDVSEILDMWQKLASVSDILRELMSMKGFDATRWTRILQAEVFLQDRQDPKLHIRVVGRHLQLHQYAALIALNQAGGDGEKIQAATKGTTSVVGSFLADATTAYVAPFAIPLLVPAMLTHLKALRSGKPLLKTLGEDALEGYHLFLCAIEDNYPAASILNRVLTAARDSAAAVDLIAAAEQPSSKLMLGEPMWHMDWSSAFTPPSWSAGFDTPVGGLVDVSY